MGDEGFAEEEEGEIYLYKVIDRQTIPREEVRGLWQEGKVSGLFNLPTEELFNACRDFGVKVDISDLRKAKEESVGLRSKLKTLIERSVDKERELFEVRAKMAELAQANLLQEGEFKKKLNELTRNNKALVKDSKKLAKEKNEMKEENQRLKAEMERMKQQLEEAKARERKREEQERQRKLEEKQRREQMKEQEIEQQQKGQSRGSSRSQQVVPGSPLQERSKLQAELKRERDLLRQMAVEHQRLTARVQQLMIENEEMKLSSSITQTDHLNRSLLLSFMNTMDSLNLVDEDDEADAEEWDEALAPGEDEAGDYYGDYGDGEEGETAADTRQRGQWITATDDDQNEETRSSREERRDYPDYGE